MDKAFRKSRTVYFSIATTQDNLDDKLRKFEIRDMMGLTDDRDISETVSETWSTDVLGSDFDPNIDEDRLQEIAGNECALGRSCAALEPKAAEPSSSSSLPQQGHFHGFNWRFALGGFLCA